MHEGAEEQLELRGGGLRACESDAVVQSARRAAAAAIDAGEDNSSGEAQKSAQCRKNQTKMLETMACIQGR